MHPTTAEDILNILYNNHVRIPDLIVSLLSLDREQNIKPKFRELLNDLVINSDRVLSAFASHPATETNTKNWVHARAKGIYLEEITRISSKSGGFHFRAYDASSQQIMDFDAGTLVPRVANEVPFLWDLNRSFLRGDDDIKGFMDLDWDEIVDARDVVCTSNLYIHYKSLKYI